MLLWSKRKCKNLNYGLKNNSLELSFLIHSSNLFGRIVEYLSSGLKLQHLQTMHKELKFLVEEALFLPYLMPIMNSCETQGCYKLEWKLYL